MLGTEPVAAPGVGVVMLPPGMDGLLIPPVPLVLPVLPELPVLPVLPVLPIGDELLPIGVAEVVSGTGVVTAGAAVLVGVVGVMVVEVSSFLPQAAKASSADSATTVKGVRRLNATGFMRASLKKRGENTLDGTFEPSGL